MNLRAYALRCFDALAAWIPARVKGRLFRCWLAESIYPGVDGLRELQDTSWALMNLRRAGFAPTKIVDCWAYVGKWTKDAKAIFPHARVLMLEASAENRPALSAVDLIKLDVQGYELEVLKGARRALQTASVVLLEVAFLQYNREAPLAHQVLTAMAEHGFVAFDIGAMSRWGRQNTLLQADIIFVRPDAPWRPTSFNF